MPDPRSIVAATKHVVASIRPFEPVDAPKGVGDGVKVARLLPEQVMLACILRRRVRRPTLGRCG
jgi:hypothetical protein